MTVNRRTAIRHFIFIAGGTVFLPACLQEDGKASVPLKNLKIKASDEKLLSEMVGTIIPATDTPGAKELNGHLFLLKMVDDCTDKEGQQGFVKGMDAFKDDGCIQRRLQKAFQPVIYSLHPGIAGGDTECH